jgi:hypothetical protein
MTVRWPWLQAVWRPKGPRQRQWLHRQRLYGHRNAPKPRTRASGRGGADNQHP